jgi:hypothetical protein
MSWQAASRSVARIGTMTETNGVMPASKLLTLS